MHYSHLDTGIYDTTQTDEQQMAQGKTFNLYSKKYESVTGNNLPYLTLTSSPNWTSIIEALNGDNSLGQMNAVIKKKISEYEAEYNQILSAYSVQYKIFSNSILNVSATQPLTASDIQKNAIIVADLRTKNARLLTLARLIVTDINKLETSDKTNQLSLNQQRIELINSMNKLESEKQEMYTKKYDEDSLTGSIETSELNHRSKYIHYLVLFIIAVTILSFLFYISVNPNANVMNAVYVVGTLIILYIALIKFNS
jgi:hypothetical protein